MPKGDRFDATFAAQRKILEPYGRRMVVTADKPDDYQIAFRDKVDRIGRPLFVAAVQIKKTYVSFHLLPLYACPTLVKTVSPALRRRMQGKACFNFTAIDRAQLAELKALTKSGVTAMKTIEVPWAKRRS